MASVIWNSSRILFIDYFKKGKTINNDYYCAVLDRRINHKKTPSFVKEKMHVFVRQCTRSQIDKDDGKNQWITLRIAPPLPWLYSPDLAPSDFYLFPNLKRWLQGQRRHKWITIEIAKVYQCLRRILWIIEMLFYSKNNKANFWIWTFNSILNNPIKMNHMVKKNLVGLTKIFFCCIAIKFCCREKQIWWHNWKIF